MLTDGLIQHFLVCLVDIVNKQHGYTIWFSNGARLTESKTWLNIFVFSITYVHCQS